MNIKKLKENNFEAGASGNSGTLNYSQQYGIPSGGNVSQPSSKFDSSTKNKFIPNSVSGSVQQTLPDRPDRIGNNQGINGTNASGNPRISGIPGGKVINTIPDINKPNGDDEEGIGTDKDGQVITSPSGKANDLQANKPLNPEKEYDHQVDQIFQKKDTPSPDEIMSALQYELSNMTKKDKHIAKQIVLKNLKTDPHYYSRLNMLNIDDDKMKVDENSTISKTKAVLDEMIAARQKNRAVTQNDEINQIFKDLSDKRKSVKKY